jgi:hypothetical protein
MSKYKNLDKYLGKKGKKPSIVKVKKDKSFNKMLRAEKDELLEKIAKNLGYIE